MLVLRPAHARSARDGGRRRPDRARARSGRSPESIRPGRRSGWRRLPAERPPVRPDRPWWLVQARNACLPRRRQPARAKAPAPRRIVGRMAGLAAPSHSSRGGARHRRARKRGARQMSSRFPDGLRDKLRQAAIRLLAGPETAAVAPAARWPWHQAAQGAEEHRDGEMARSCSKYSLNATHTSSRRLKLIARDTEASIPR